jgi:predicted amidohydrolase
MSAFAVGHYVLLACPDPLLRAIAGAVLASSGVKAVDWDAAITTDLDLAVVPEHEALETIALASGAQVVLVPWAPPRARSVARQAGAPVVLLCLNSEL